MAEDHGLAPIPLPRPLERRMRLGPFPTARDAMRFAAYAAAGAIVVPIGGALAWLPILALGFVLSVVRPEGKGLDDRAGDYLRWRWRRRHPENGRSSPVATSGSETYLRLPGPVTATILEAGGVPIRFLPPSDARALFDRYRELLRTVESGVHLDVGSAPIPGSPFHLPKRSSYGPAEAAARTGYQEMAKLLLRRRRLRRVCVLLFESGSDPVSLRRLNERTDAFQSGLAGLGVPVDRLRGPNLSSAAETLGWTGRLPP
ncbi:MAG: hypothetical protein L3J95_04385 [Thermoplasmata archaeon]|nr:hypothetical protein [Thermoplasmata archaeon]MCI4359643.1 hypothetical protein [Thermoplasmata archaeon]